jgi:hypothetical protein
MIYARPTQSVHCGKRIELAVAELIPVAFSQTLFHVDRPNLSGLADDAAQAANAGNAGAW